MKEYASIETVFVRDATTNRLQFGEVRLPEVEVVKDWTISEKIDGTNIRAIVTRKGIDVRGRTDKAQLQPGLDYAVRKALPEHTALLAYFTEYRGKELPDEWSVTLYGEGYGAGVQQGGKYGPDKRFRVFDLLLGEGWWTDDAEMRRVCADLSIPTAPHLGYTTAPPTTREELLALIPESVVAIEDSGTYGVLPEGVVAKPRVVLLDRHGHRVMWKLTLREWKAVEVAA